ncbi:HdeD family acid-resistance protein [Flavobacterium sp. HBTb2-11-1]|uniref:HdeD family acid-resistance protein n=1 Tax=Flavobacterium sp. HBTb2-11-1 TaxID=2692212 RepID=UPI0013719114|nr:DUF308 domain-containing protein [Flavobacterium sp. HBTb2-11-1]MXO03492.1 HdeD family acid-resistance protein [Flavobacterium sp. HBTb2-11-1]
MKALFVEELKNTVNNWWISLLVGILFIGVALLLMFYPLDGYAALSIMFSVCMFVCGIAEIAFSVSNRENLSGWGWYFTGGIIDFIMGAFLMYYPTMSMAVLPVFVAFWLMFRGFSMIGFSFDLQAYGSKGWGWLLASGILIVISSFVIIWYPVSGALSVVYLVAFTFLFIGMARIMLSFDLKKLKDDNKKLQQLINRNV